MLCQRQCQQNYKENGHKIQGVHGLNKDIFKSFFIKECHNNKFVNSFFLNLCILTFILMYDKLTYKFDYQIEKSPMYPMDYIGN